MSSLRSSRRRARRVLALVAACALPSLIASGATVKKADDKTVIGPLIALENGAVVIGIDDGSKTGRTSIPLEDVVELTIDPAIDGMKPATTTTTSATQPATANSEESSGIGLPGSNDFFDRRTLKGWDGDADIWSVEQGAITCKVADNTTDDRVTYLTHTTKEYDDFQLTYTFKIEGGTPGGSGVQFRSTATAQNGRKVVTGYQQDLGTPAGLAGGIVDNGANAGNGQPVKAGVGERVVYKPDGTREVFPLEKSADQLNAVIDPNGWNNAVLVAKGNTVVSMINGQIFAIVVNESPNGSRNGSIAFQVSRRKPMTAQFKNVSIRRLPSDRMPSISGVPWKTLLSGGTPAPVAPTAVAVAATPAMEAPAISTPAPTTQPAANTPWQVKLAGGDEVSGELAAWDGKQLLLKTSHGELAIPVKQIREVWRGSANEIAKAKAAAQGESKPGGRGPTQDLAFARKDDQIIPVAGLALGVDTGALKFRFQDADRRITLDKLVGVTLAPAEDAVPDESLQQTLVLTSGDVLSGKWTGLSDGRVSLDMPWGAKIDVALKNVQRVRTKNGRLVYLSDLTPTQVEQVPYFDRFLPFRIDQSLTGTPIKLADGEHARGVSVHSRTVLRYDIGRRYERFRAKLGFQLPEGKAGRVAVRVLGDGETVLHEIPDLRGDQPPVDLDLPVAGVSRLTLEVDFGEDQDVADRVAWAEARLLRAAK